MMGRGLGIRIRWGGCGCRWEMAIGHVVCGGRGVDERRLWGWRGGPCVGDVFDDGRAGDDVSEGAEGVLKRNR